MKALFKRAMGVSAVALSVGFVAPAMTLADTLADALAGAYEHSGLLDQNRALLRAADEGVATANAALKPILSWSASFDNGFGRSGSSVLSSSLSGNDVTLSLIASLLLYDFGTSKLRVEAAKETVLATRDELLNIEQQVLLRAVTAFMNVRSASEFVALRRNNLGLLREELRAAQDRFELGAATRTDVALAEASLAEARSGLASAEGDLLVAIEEYRNVVGRKPGSVVTPPKLPRTETNVEQAKALALRNHPSLHSVQHQVAAAELNIMAAEAAVKPTINLNGNLTVQEDLGSSSFTRGGSVGVEIGGPIYSGGSLSSAIRQAQATRDALRGLLHTTRHDIAQDVGNALAGVQVARASLEANERQIRAARVAFQGVREEATLGERTTLDVLDAEQDLLDAEAARISSQTDQYIAAYTALAALGLLTAEKLQLNVQLYDPAAYYELVKDGVAQKSKQGKQLDRVLRALQKE